MSKVCASACHLPTIMSQSSGCWKLPHELIDAIIDELHRETAGLVPCALVHSTWRPRAQHHLFNDMTFNLAPPLPVPEHQQLHRLADSLADNPKLAGLMHYLKIQGSCAIASEIHFEILQSGCNALLRIIPLLANVQTVTVADFVGNLSWDRLSYSLQNAIFNLLFHPSVTSVHILGVHGIPLLPLAQCKHLECLEIEYVSPDPAELDAPFPLTFGEAFALGDCDAPRRHLRTLALSNTSLTEICR
ncbi:hypothetical protein BKA70DRAFT_683749 [Coprinopsis sp. MPI-PUGE-AT-0042]|nr:hypothetical protein BKA70DRAFT_683749 [Coprinopsis sp. MPI-PUGE-AT-0042]